jgi:hypothetical protein
MSEDRAIFSTVLEFFQEDDWPIEVDSEKTSIRTSFRGEHGQWNCFAKVGEKQQQFVFYSSFPVLVPVEKRLAVSEFLTRANYGLILGNFEMDFEDGQVNFKTSLDAEGQSFNTMAVGRLVYTNVLMMQQFFQGLMAVLYSNQTPAEAVASVEK